MVAHGGGSGFAAFGRVVDEMDTVRHILAAPTVPNAGREPMKGQMIEAPVKIVSARRLPQERSALRGDPIFQIALDVAKALANKGNFS